MATRKEVHFGDDPNSDDWIERAQGVRMTVTHKGVEVVGWYDNFCHGGDVTVTWEELDEAREEVNKRG